MLVAAFLSGPALAGQPSASGTAPAGARASVWLTTGDQAKLLHQEAAIEFATGEPGANTIAIDASRKYQEIVGFGASFTDASAWLLHRRMSADQRKALLTELVDPKHGIGLNFFRLTIGSSDFSMHHYTLDDVPAGETDMALKHFSIEPNRADVLPVVKEALAINRDIKIMSSPWSAPAWMKANDHLYTGALRPDRYGVFSDYLMRYLDAYEREGIPVYAISLQNEPHFEPPDYPGMRVDPPARAALIGQHLGPRLAQRKHRVRLIEWDHNWNEPESPLAVLADPVARQYIDGIGWHCYVGDVATQSVIHNQYPDKETYFTECSGGEWKPHFSETFAWFMRHLIIGTTRHWAKGVMLWNLALDENHGPHLGGCKDCRGVVTINSKTGAVTRNLEYYALAHASRFVQPGARRLQTDVSGSNDIDAVAFENPNGSIALLASNSGAQTVEFSVTAAPGVMRYRLSPGSAATFVWPGAATSK